MSFSSFNPRYTSFFLCHPPAVVQNRRGGLLMQISCISRDLFGCNIFMPMHRQAEALENYRKVLRHLKTLHQSWAAKEVTESDDELKHRLSLETKALRESYFPQIKYNPCSCSPLCREVLMNNHLQHRRRRQWREVSILYSLFTSLATYYHRCR